MKKIKFLENKASEPSINYLDLQAYTGATKHMGGLEATNDLIKLCHVTKGGYILDVGCGVGATVDKFTALKKEIKEANKEE